MHSILSISTLCTNHIMHCIYQLHYINDCATNYWFCCLGSIKIRPYKVLWQVPNIYMACFANIWIRVMRTSTHTMGETMRAVRMYYSCVVLRRSYGTPEVRVMLITGQITSITLARG